MKVRAVLASWLIAAGASFAAEPAATEPAPLFRIQFAPIGGAARPENFSLAELNAALVVETNRVRVAHGCRPLHFLPALAAAADDQAVFMAMTLHVTHSNLIAGQRDVLERTKNRGLERASIVAENALCTGFAGPREPPPSCAEVAAAIVAQWMDSPGHRENLLNRAFTDVGCAARRANLFGNQAEIFATQVFAAR